MAEQEQNLFDDDYGVLPFCSMLYQMSAKCNTNLDSKRGYYVDGVYYEYEAENMYQSEQQADQENKICGMIESLNSGTYQEDGSITIGTQWFSGSRIQNELSSATGIVMGRSRSGPVTNSLI